MTVKDKKIFNLIIVLIVFLLSISLLQFFSYAIDSDFANEEVETVQTRDESEEGLIPAIRNMVSQWYYIFRYFSIVAMLIILIYLGIKMAITSSASDKAQYKRMLMDWVVGFAIIFCIHYFMILVLNINTTCVNFIKDIADAKSREIALTKGVETCSNIVDGKPCYACEACKKVLESNSVGLYETIRTRAYEFRVGIGTSGMVMYMVLVYYTIRFAIIYFKRFFTIMILTIIAPLVGLSYAFTKVKSGKAPIISKWAQEYCFNVLLQTIHALIYTIFVTLALMLSTQSIAGFILAMIMLNFMIKADKIFRKIFKFSGSLLNDNADKDMKENFAALTAIKTSTAAVFGGAMAKDAKNAVKSGASVVGNLGTRTRTWYL